ncbi:MAG: class I SAM-dependent DNA methyltransferase [Deltaproteobacteria bacterium]|nr:class I SAM-dependent DNA methyltransferase [Deltaproteobacteria bacterium]
MTAFPTSPATSNADTANADAARVAAFVKRWRDSGGGELANSQTYLGELCDLLDVPRPTPLQAEEAKNHYVFEMPVRDPYLDKNGPPLRIDLYHQDAFVLEAKQGVGEAPLQNGLFDNLLAPTGPVKKGIGLRDSAKWHEKMAAARAQAQRYVTILPAGHRPPPFLLVVDVGHCIEVWSNFARDGKAYTQFPSRERFRIYHESPAGRVTPTLADPEVRQLLATIWTNPESLDPSRHAARVSREAAEVLADLAKLLEMPVEKGGGGHSPEAVAQFLMRCMFTMFSEDVGLLPAGAFAELLDRAAHQPHAFSAWLGRLWEEMNTGVDFSLVLKDAPPVRKFNGQLFSQQFVLPLRAEHIALLKKAADRDWSQVEPAIFGTLLERALSPTERHKLGAHYTPRAYVERLVNPTVIEPLRADWRKAQAEATAYEAMRRGTGLPVLERFHQSLCAVRILDPACGSGNFLYVTLDLLKRLEGEVQQAIDDLRAELGMPPRGIREGGGESVHPRQFLGIEVNPRAAVIAEAVLWIGYLQWQAKNLSSNDPELARKLRERSVLEKLGNIENRDAVLAWDGPEGRPLEGVPVLEPDGSLKTVWDGVSTKKHPVTGLDVPDESKRRVLYAYPNARRAEWPKVDFVVGNPPFIGNKRMRTALGDGYVEALRAAWSEVPETIDFVMYWWHAAAKVLGAGGIRQFGFITTNSITQTFNRQVIADHSGKEVRLAFAIPDHPWVDSTEGAAVRVAMTSAVRGTGDGVLSAVVAESSRTDGEVEVVIAERLGAIHPDLKVGPNVAAAVQLRGNRGLSFMGVTPVGAGFLVPRETAAKLSEAQAGELAACFRPYWNGKDIADRRRELFAIDFFGLTSEEAWATYPAAYQWVLEKVKPERDLNNREVYRRNWWLFAEARRGLRIAIQGLPRYIATCRTAKHRAFVFLNGADLPDSKVIAIANADAFGLGCLTSRVHLVFALASGSHLEDRPNYNNSECFEKFPFPAATPDQQSRIRDLGERLDAHRKRQQSLHPDLTLTGMYNVLEALRAGRPLTDKERAIHEKGLCTLLLQIHNDLDAAVFDAYGWPHDLDDEAILQRLVDLNAERAEEERKGLIRWLRPEFQNPQGGKAVQVGTLELTEGEAEEDVAPVKRPKFSGKPGEALDQLQAELARAKAPRSAVELAEAFEGARVEAVELLLSSLATFGAARVVEGGGWVVG